jgi:hypothetical protein
MNYTSEHAVVAEESLTGVGGWLKLFVVVNLYITPVFFALQSLLALVGFAALADDYPSLMPIGLLEVGVGGFLVWKWIEIARSLRDVQPGAVREAKTWLGRTLAIRLAVVPLDFLTGLDAEDLMLGAVKSVVLGLLGFAIWYSYFSVSKRVKATYPDWSEQ